MKVTVQVTIWPDWLHPGGGAAAEASGRNPNTPIVPTAAIASSGFRRQPNDPSL
jgi:hypothetical protein